MAAAGWGGVWQWWPAGAAQGRGTAVGAASWWCRRAARGLGPGRRWQRFRVARRGAVRDNRQSMTTMWAKENYKRHKYETSIGVLPTTVKGINMIYNYTHNTELKAHIFLKMDIHKIAGVVLEGNMQG